MQLINAVRSLPKMRKSLGNKRNEIGDEHIDEITRLYRDFEHSEHSKIFDNDDFGYRQITVERPLRLNFQQRPERIERLKAETAFQNLATSKKKGKAAEEESRRRSKQQASWKPSTDARCRRSDANAR